MSPVTTYWNGEPCEALRVRVIVGDTGRYPRYWARELVGQEREAVQVFYFDKPFYLDNEDGSGWRKVTEGHGSPAWSHLSLEAERVIHLARCRVCGCTDDRACPGGCSWVEPDLCSACVEAPE